jgi:uncharacterized protein
MQKFLKLCLIVLCGLTGFAYAQNAPQRDLQRARLSAGMHLIEVQLATTQEQRMLGLMHRTDMPANEGMLFVFEQAATQCFWMKDTLIPLSAAFIADDGSIVNMVNMQPHSTQSHCSTKPVRFVLEMNQGWFAKRGIGPGFQIKGTPFKGRAPQ